MCSMAVSRTLWGMSSCSNPWAKSATYSVRDILGSFPFLDFVALGDDSGAHLLCGGSTAEVSGEMFPFRYHALYGGFNAPGSGTQAVLAVLCAEPLQEHLAGHDHGVRVGDAPAGDIRGGAVGGLRHRLRVPGIEARRHP